MHRIKRMMLLDDDFKTHVYIADILKMIPELDCELDAFQGFDEAMSALEQRVYDVCIIDYQLNDPHNRNGIDFIRIANTNYPYLPMIVLTAHGTDDTASEALQVGAMDYIDKDSLRPASLAKTIRYALRRVTTLRELHALYQQVSIVNQIRADVIRLANHDIKNPLTTIFMSIDMLKSYQEASENEFVQRHVQRIDAAANRIKSIVNDVLSLDYLDDGDEFQQTDIVMLIDSVFKEFSLLGTDNSKDLIFEHPRSFPTVRGIPGQLREVMFNLLTNAIKYTPVDAQIQVEIISQSHEVIVHVIDNGFGVPDAYHNELFKPFSRVLTAQTEEIEGTGLGLYLVKRIIDRHGGKIIFESTYGKGSTFGFRLPIV